MVKQPGRSASLALQATLFNPTQRMHQTALLYSFPDVIRGECKNHEGNRLMYIDAQIEDDFDTVKIRERFGSAVACSESSKLILRVRCSP